MWGIGRHLLGSQIYDYWSTPGAGARALVGLRPPEQEERLDLISAETA